MISSLTAGAWERWALVISSIGSMGHSIATAERHYLKIFEDFDPGGRA